MGGRLVLMGSGELAPTMVPIHRQGLAAAGTDLVTVLDSSYGFQENADELTERIRSFFATSLGARVTVASLRRADASAGVRARAVAAVEEGDYLFAGPGSPSYALGVWSTTGVGDALRRRLSAGATVTLASAAALTAGVKTIPVYEIYKVGADPFWLDGLDLTGPLGLAMVVVPHWNNTEGGTHDTSRCYIGRRRFDLLASRLDTGVVGIDEHTAAIFDFGAGTLRVAGRGTVTLLAAEEVVFSDGDETPLDEVAALLGSMRRPPEVPPSDDHGLPPLWEALAAGDVAGAVDALVAAVEAADSTGARRALEASFVRLVELAVEGSVEPRRRIGGLVDLIVEVRERLRKDRRWELADLIRDRLGELGVEVQDRREGPVWRIGGGEGGLWSQDGAEYHDVSFE